MMSGKLLDNAEECSVFSFLVLTLQFFKFADSATAIYLNTGIRQS